MNVSKLMNGFDLQYGGGWSSIVVSFVLEALRTDLSHANLFY